MNVLITEIIGSQAFEIVIQRVRDILETEIRYQIKAQCLEDEVSVFQDRGTPPHQEEEVVISVSLDNSSFKKLNQRAVQSETKFNVDVYANGQANSVKSGYLVSTQKAYKYLGMCRYILSSTRYNLLAFPSGLVSNVNVDSLNMYEVGDNQDGSHIKMGRLQLSARLCEDQELWTGVLLGSHLTRINLEDTNIGHQLIIENE